MEKRSNLKNIIIRTLDSNKALDRVSIDLKNKSSMADHMIIASGTSSRHIQALSEQVLEKFKNNGIINCKIEGKDSNDWKLIDGIDLIVHIFTTLNPNLGVAVYDDKEITLADIPGIIEGAHEGTGLGIKFLKHIERCNSLLHLIDITEEDLKKSYTQVRKELKTYSKDMLKKEELVVLNKTDLLEDKEVKKIKNDFLKKYKGNLITLSTLDNL